MVNRLIHATIFRNYNKEDIDEKEQARIKQQSWKQKN